MENQRFGEPVGSPASIYAAISALVQYLKPVKADGFFAKFS